MAIPEDERIMISALQHYAYCPRQFHIIHVERLWRENFFTADGKRLHERVDLPGSRCGRGRRVEYALPLASARYGLAGLADAVEFSADSATPIEYKRGRRKPDNRDAVQLCAQAFCLEEMLNASVPRGCLFYFETRERISIELDDALRAETAATIDACRKMLETGFCEEFPYSKKCRACSLLELCMPPRRRFSATEYWKEALKE